MFRPTRSQYSLESDDEIITYSRKQTQTTLTDLSANLVQLCDRVIADRDVVIINRPDGENLASPPIKCLA